MRTEMRDAMKDEAMWAGLVLTGVGIAALLLCAGCETVAPWFGYECKSDPTLTPPTEGIDAGMLTTIGGGITAGLIYLNNIWRNYNAKKKLTRFAAGVAGAIKSSQAPSEVNSILTEALPGAAKVEPGKVAEIVADAKTTVAEEKAQA